MRTSESLAKISVDLMLAHAEIKHAPYDAKNPHFKNDYASLESVIDSTKAIYLKHNIIVIQGGDGKSLVTRLQHSSGEYIESSLELVLDKQNMQGVGSAITYARRYSLAAMSNISQVDDDANEASVINLSKAVQNSKIEEKQKGYDFKGYTIQLGDKNSMTGTKLNEHKLEYLNKTLNSTVNWYNEKKKPMHSNSKEFVEMTSAYLEFMDFKS